MLYQQNYPLQWHTRFSICNSLKTAFCIMFVYWLNGCYILKFYLTIEMLCFFLVHTMEELKLTGNHFNNSRPLLTFSTSFGKDVHWKLLKEMITQVHSPFPFILEFMCVLSCLYYTVIDDVLWPRTLFSDLFPCSWRILTCMCVSVIHTYWILYIVWYNLDLAKIVEYLKSFS